MIFTGLDSPSESNVLEHESSYELTVYTIFCGATPQLFDLWRYKLKNKRLHSVQQRPCNNISVEKW